MLRLTGEEGQKVVDYLNDRPHGEVRSLIDIFVNAAHIEQQEVKQAEQRKQQQREKRKGQK